MSDSTRLVTELELHIGPAPLTRAHARAIRQAGGRFTRCSRVFERARVVTLPIHELKLAGDLVRAYGPPAGRVWLATVVFRGTGLDDLPDHEVVYYLDVGERLETVEDCLARHLRHCVNGRGGFTLRWLPEDDPVYTSGWQVYTPLRSRTPPSAEPSATTRPTWQGTERPADGEGALRSVSPGMLKRQVHQSTIG